MTDSNFIWLDQVEQGWAITSGKVDVFVTPLEAGQPGALHHLFRLEAGQALFGAGRDANTPMALVARGVADAQLQPFTFQQLLAPEQRPQTVRWLEAWISNLAAAIASEVPPKESRVVTASHPLDMAAGEIARATDRVIWLQADHAQLFGVSTLPTVFPLVGNLWAKFDQPIHLTPLETPTLVASDKFTSSLGAFHRLALERLQQLLQERDQTHRARQRAAAQSDQQAVQKALIRLALVMKGAPDEQGAALYDDTPLLAACRLIGAELGVVVQPAPETNLGARQHPVEAIARASRLRTRRIALRGQWWQADNGPLLAFAEGDKRPLALIQDSLGRYHCLEASARQPLTPALAATLEPFAFSFYRTLPDRVVSVAEFLRFGLRHTGRDFLAIALAGLALGLVGLLPALVTSVIFDAVIPASSQARLLLFAGLLITGAVSAALFQLVRNMAALRIEARYGVATEAAIWDRLLNLPVMFFKAYTSGDLATRIAGLETVRQTVAGLAGSAILTAFFSLTNLALLFYYNASLAWVAVGLASVVGLATVVASAIYLRVARQINAARSRLAGLVLQLITGVTRLRVTGAEARAFAVWADRFAQQRRLTFRARVLGNWLTTFNAAFPPLAAAVIFGSIVIHGRGVQTTGELLAFVYALGGLLSALLAVSAHVLGVMRVVPMFEHARPILEATPEVGAHKSQPGQLNGALTLSHITFRYKADGPPILKDVSIEARPGEFVAVVGPSGSGKSTLMRLILGFEKPEAGAVYFDAQDLDSLDVSAVRRQIGVVLQNSKLIPGSVYSNIVGASLLTFDDAWAAARLAGLEADLRLMPMGMHTIISEGAATFSDGQRQRLLIARAIANRPRLLLFDEATSALDNRTQAIVSRSLEALQATRIVIAHRLSTILNADHIYVLDAGRVVQHGPYPELARVNGLFQDLIRRQVI